MSQHAGQRVCVTHRQLRGHTPRRPRCVHARTHKPHTHTHTHLVKVEQQVRAVRHEQAACPLDARVIHRLELLKERGRVHNHTVAQQVLCLRVDEAARQQMERKLTAICNHRVAGVGATIEARNQIVTAAGKWGQRGGYIYQR